MKTRRRFLSDIGLGTLCASLTAVAPTRVLFAAGFDPDRLRFGPLDDLVDRMQAASPSDAMRLAADAWRAGASLETVATAAGLANARAFGGEDYTGYHAFMAMIPAYQIGRTLPEEQRPLPLLKVIHRSARQMEATGAQSRDTLNPISAAGEGTPQALHERTLAVDMDAAEETFLSLLHRSGEDAAFDGLLPLVRDEMDVHRIVLAWRSFDMLRLAGPTHADTLLRQLVRFCVSREAKARQRPRNTRLRDGLADWMRRRELVGASIGTRRLSDDALQQLADDVFGIDDVRAADSMARAIQSGVCAEDLGQALIMASNRLLLEDPGRRSDPTEEKPLGSVHGASTGVHASDSANAWRHAAEHAHGDERIAAYIAGAYHTAGQSSFGGRFSYQDELARVGEDDEQRLRDALREAIAGRDQARACAVVDRYGRLNLPEAPLFALLRENAIAEDGALHAEKYFWTAYEEFHAARPAFRWRHAITLARVAASQHTIPAPGLEEACDLLG